MIRNIVRTRTYNTYYDDSYYYPTYSSYYYDTPYEPVYGSPLTVNYVYYGTPYYYEPQVSYVYVPQYGATYYDPYYYQNYSYYGGQQSYYPTYSSYGYPSNAGYADYYDAGYGYDDDQYLSVLSQLPVAELVQGLTGNSFISELLGGFLNQGYDQGYIDGEYAREYGDDDSSYYDPYAYHDTSYDTYSLNLAENRRIFSEGYEAGYSDAIAARADDYSPYQDSQPDLVGLLVGNVLSGI